MSRKVRCKECVKEKVCTIHGDKYIARGKRRWCEEFVKKEEKKSNIPIWRRMKEKEVSEVKANKEVVKTSDVSGYSGVSGYEPTAESGYSAITETKKGLWGKVKDIFNK